jgi:cyanate permease
MLNISNFGNTAEIYAIVHLVLYACQHITVDPSHSSGDMVAKIIVFSDKTTWRVSLSIGVRITTIHYVVYLLRIFKMFHGLMNNPVY